MAQEKVERMTEGARLTQQGIYTKWDHPRPCSTAGELQISPQSEGVQTLPSTLSLSNGIRRYAGAGEESCRI